MFTYRLAEMQDKVTANCLHPGFVDTNIGGNEGNVIKKIVKFGSRIFARTVQDGADSSIYLSTSDEVENVTGKYFFEENIAPRKNMFRAYTWNRNNV